MTKLLPCQHVDTSFRSCNGTLTTHIDFKVFGGGVDAARGGVVARQVVQRHVADGDGVRQRDDQRALDAVESPTFAWEQHREALGGRSC